MGTSAAPPNHPRTSALLLSVAIGLLAEGAGATIFTPLRLEDLARGSAGVITGVVQTLTSVETSEQEIVTLVEVRVTEVLRGHLDAAVITLKEDGGRVGERIEVVYGTPRFRRGEQVLLFLSTRADGSLRTRQMAFGKFSVVGEGAAAQGVRDIGPGVSVLLAPGELPPPRRIPMSEIRTAVADTNAHPGTGPQFLPLMAPREAGDPTLAREPVSFSAEPVDHQARFFEVDEGLPIGMFIDEDNDSFLGPGAAREVWHGAMAAWTGVSTASIVLWDAGRNYPPQGPLLSFRDNPFSDGCSLGVAGVGGWAADASEVKQFGGVNYVRTTGAFAIVFRDHPDCNGLYTRCNAAEVATHEVGHAIGLEHSSNPDATMSGGPAFDCRCASLRPDDVQAVSRRYPLATPPTVTTPAILPDATAGMPYELQLTAIGGTGTLTWAFAEDGLNPGIDDFRPGLVLSPDGVLSGVPVDEAFAGDYVERGLIKVTDANGDFHTKRFFIRINPAGITTTTATSTTTSTAVEPIVDGSFPCETTTTTVPPSPCDLADGFPGVECKVAEGQRLVSTFPRRQARGRKLLRLVGARAERARIEIARRRGSTSTVLRLLNRSERYAGALGEISRRPRFVDAVGTQNAAALATVSEVLISRLQELRATLSVAR